MTITVYTLPSNSSSRHAVNFLKTHKLPFKEIKMTTDLTMEDLLLILSRVDDIDEIISTRSFARSGYDALMANEETTMNQIYQYILDNPKILRSPIVFDDKRTQIGSSDDDMSTFLPRDHKKKTFSLILEEVRKNQEYVPESEELEEEYA